MRAKIMQSTFTAVNAANNSDFPLFFQAHICYA